MKENLQLKLTSIEPMLALLGLSILFSYKLSGQPNREEEGTEDFEYKYTLWKLSSREVVEAKNDE